MTGCVHDASQTRQLLLFGFIQYNAHHRDIHPGGGCVLGRDAAPDTCRFSVFRAKSMAEEIPSPTLPTTFKRSRARATG